MNILLIAKNSWTILPELSAKFDREEIPDFVCATNFFHWKDLKRAPQIPDLIIVDSEEMRNRVMDCCKIAVIYIHEFRPNILKELRRAA